MIWVMVIQEACYFCVGFVCAGNLYSVVILQDYLFLNRWLQVRVCPLSGVENEL